LSCPGSAHPRSRIGCASTGLPPDRGLFGGPGVGGREPGQNGVVMTDAPSAEERLRTYRQTGDRAIRNRVVEEHMWLATTLAREFHRGSEPLADLVQVAAMGVVKAAERFDPDYGASFTSFAAVTIRGELRRHYRDHGWTMRVPRRLQELRAEVRSAVDTLAMRNGRSPRVPEIAAYLHVATDEVIDALCADENYRPLSLEERTGDGPTLGEQTGVNEPSYALVEADEAFSSVVRLCPSRLQRLLHLRYVEGLTQAEIAAEVGISQVHVSRLLHRAHRQLRAQLDTPDGMARAQAG
jgi:RNA polymerase sigma-B factor